MGNQKKGFFRVKDNVCYTGTHLLFELRGARSLSSIAHIKRAFISAVKATKATFLEVKLHHFSPNKGISKVVIISESHISIHAWPEFDYTAIDIFASKKTGPQSVDLFNVVSKYRKFCRDMKYYNFKIHLCSFILSSYIMN